MKKIFRFLALFASGFGAACSLIVFLLGLSGLIGAVVSGNFLNLESLKFTAYELYIFVLFAGHLSAFLIIKNNK